MISVTTEAAPEENVVMRNTWITWKAMYQCWVLSSTLPRVTSPLSFAINRHTMGTKAIKMASITDGKRPVTTPKIWLGISLMLPMAPTTATGIDQNRIIKTMKVVVPIFLSILCGLLGVELDEDRWEKLSIEFLLSHLPLLNFRDKSSELASGPFDGIDFLSDQGDLSSAVFWAILVLHKSRT